MKNVALNTHVALANLQLSQGQMYYVYVIGKYSYKIVQFVPEYNLFLYILYFNLAGLDL